MAFYLRAIYLCMLALFLSVYGINLSAQEKSSNYVHISKSDMELTVYNVDGQVLFRCMVGCGKELGNKQKKGDNRTPEGCFPITQIQNSSHWAHD